MLEEFGAGNLLLAKEFVDIDVGAVPHRSLIRSIGNIDLIGIFGLFILDNFGNLDSMFFV